jgi:tetratricopeptide (TPR) repeat protein
LDSVTFSDPLIATVSKSILFAKFDADVDTALASKYGVAGFPTMVITKPNGMEIDRLVGYYPPAEFIPALVDLLSNRNTLDALLSKTVQYPDSLQLVFDVAQNYAYRSDRAQAVYYFNHILSSDPDNANDLSDDAWFELANMKRKEGKTEDAVEMFAALGDKFPESDQVEVAQMMIPYTYYRGGDLKNAEKHYKKFKKDFPESDRLEWIDKQLKKIKEERKKK